MQICACGEVRFSQRSVSSAPRRAYQRDSQGYGKPPQRTQTVFERNALVVSLIWQAVKVFKICDSTRNEEYGYDRISTNHAKHAGVRVRAFLCDVSTQKHLHQLSGVRGYFSLHRRMLTFCDFLRHPIRISAHTAPRPHLLSSDDKYQTTAPRPPASPPCHAPTLIDIIRLHRKLNTRVVIVAFSLQCPANQRLGQTLERGDTAR